MKINYKKIFLIIFITFIIGNLFSIFVMGNMNNYIKPNITPPGFVFPIVWTIIFLLMSISLYRITNIDNSFKYYIIYTLQLIVNSLWVLIFFKFKLFLLAFIDIIILILLVIYMIYIFYKKDKLSGLLNIPYLLWIIFASYLNFLVYLLNR